MNHRRTPWIAAVLLLVVPCVARAADPAAALRAACDALRDSVYNDDPAAAQQASYRSAIEALDAVPLEVADRGLWRARLEYYAGRGFQARGEKREAAGHYETGLAVLEATAPDDRTSEAWRMTSECISQLCLLKTVAWVVANGPKVAAYAEKAIALDPRNAAARIIIAASRLYPPAVFGGNPRRGIELMQEALALGTAARDDLFNINSGIGIAYGKLGEQDAARAWLEKALALYPGNRYVREELRKVQ